MLINFSNHPSECWGQKQLEAAKVYGEIIDIPFPTVDPKANYEDIKALADQYVQELMARTENQQVTVHIMGEMTFCFIVVSRLKGMGIECIASTTIRDAEMTEDGKKVSDFKFVRFREY